MIAPLERDEIISWLKSRGMGEQGLNTLVLQLHKSHTAAQIRKFKESFPKNDRAIFFEGYPTHMVCVTVDMSKLHAYLTLIAYEEQVPRITTLLEGVSSSVGLMLDEVSQDCFKKIRNCQDLTREDFIFEEFVQGTPPVPEQPPGVKLHVKPFSAHPEYDENDDGSVDFHNLNLFQNVIENQHIADLIPAVPGMPGRDVFGIQINPNQGKKKVVSCGHGVAFDEVQKQFFSTHSGYVTFEDQKLSVEDCYVVESDVDMGVGNINFVSDVLVRGDILPDFSIQAGRDIEVHGSVTGAMLTADQNIKLKLGILGQGKSYLKAGSNFSTKFVNETIVEVNGDIEILSECLNSEVGTLKKFLAKDAVVIGGRIVSVDEMHIGTIGSELGIRTDIFLGEDFSSLKRTDEIRQTLLEMEDMIEARQEGLREHIKHWQTDRIRERKDTEKLDQLVPRLEELQALLNEFVIANQEYELLNQNTPPARNPICHVHKKIHAGTVFYCSGDVFRVRESVQGPVTVMTKEGHKKGRVKIVIEEGISP